METDQESTELSGLETLNSSSRCGPDVANARDDPTQREGTVGSKQPGQSPATGGSRGKSPALPVIPTGRRSGRQGQLLAPAVPGSRLPRRERRLLQASGREKCSQVGQPGQVNPEGEDAGGLGKGVQGGRLVGQGQGEPEGHRPV